ncbi:hypothetical protein NOK12_20500 [Nocardioides sp. OK12]|uniref:WXG100 family type VII secretion target n=1 Tax=Nocardioides sp. OK12 TaxID=2758661 RepID=UPI0021C40817|nr:hypothetical protein [Nocardioides sp. OK12]GHJ59532.1 hypothetical protein NOK12_20500 [Nocardioides sp. OK12]
MGAWDEVEGWMGGLMGEIYSIMKPLVNPLVEQWESITGDPDSVHQVAAEWRGMAASLDSLARFETDGLAATQGGWTGLAHDSYSAAITDLASTIRDIASQVGEVGGFLDQAATEVRETQQLIRDLVFELVEWAAISLAVSAAGAIFTLGASVAAGAASAAARAAITAGKIATLLRKVEAALRRIQAMIAAYRTWLKGLSFAQRFAFKAAVEKPLVRAVTGLDGNYKDPAIDLGEVYTGYDLPAPLDGGRV